jgi:hypothetical protein
MSKTTLSTIAGTMNWGVWDKNLIKKWYDPSFV